MVFTFVCVCYAKNVATGNFTLDIMVNENFKGWIKYIMFDWLTEVWYIGKGAYFFQPSSILVMNSMKSHRIG